MALCDNNKSFMSDDNSMISLFDELEDFFIPHTMITLMVAVDSVLFVLGNLFQTLCCCCCCCCEVGDEKSVSSFFVCVVGCRLIGIVTVASVPCLVCC